MNDISLHVVPTLSAFIDDINNENGALPEGNTPFPVSAATDAVRLDPLGSHHQRARAGNDRREC